MSKYNNGRPMRVPNNPTEMDKAIQEWSEDNIHLANAIRACINNGLPTFSSCKGHKYNIRSNHRKIRKTSNKFPYLVLLVNDENIGKIINIVNVLSQHKDTKIRLGINPHMREHLSIYAQIINRSEVFDIIAKSAKKSIDLADANDFTREILKLYSFLRVYRNRSGIKEFDISLVNNNGIKKIFFTFLGNDPILGKIFSQIGIWDSWSANINLAQLRKLNELLYQKFNGFKSSADGSNKNFIKIVNSTSSIREKSANKLWKKIEEEIGTVLGTGEIPDFIDDATRRFRKVSESMGIHTNYFKDDFFADNHFQVNLTKKQIKELAEDFLSSLGIHHSVVVQISEKAARFKNKPSANKTKGPNEEQEIVSIDYSSLRKTIEKLKNNGSLDSTRYTEISKIIDDEIASSGKGTIKDLYELINRMAQVMCMKNCLNTSPTLSFEVVSQCLRRMLDEYLLAKTNETPSFYGLNRFELKRDISNRRIEEIVSNLKSSRKLVTGEFSGLQEESELASHMISLILSTKFSTFKGQERINKIFELIRIVNRGTGILELGNCLGVQLNGKLSPTIKSCIENNFINFQQLIVKDQEIKTFMDTDEDRDDDDGRG